MPCEATSPDAATTAIHTLRTDYATTHLDGGEVGGCESRWGERDGKGESHPLVKSKASETRVVFWESTREACLVTEIGWENEFIQM